MMQKQIIFSSICFGFLFSPISIGAGGGFMFKGSPVSNVQKLKWLCYGGALLEETDGFSLPVSDIKKLIEHWQGVANRLLREDCEGPECEEWEDYSVNLEIQMDEDHSNLSYNCPHVPCFCGNGFIRNVDQLDQTFSELEGLHKQAAVVQSMYWDRGDGIPVTLSGYTDIKLLDGKFKLLSSALLLNGEHINFIPDKAGAILLHEIGHLAGIMHLYGIDNDIEEKKYPDNVINILAKMVMYWRTSDVKVEHGHILYDEKEAYEQWQAGIITDPIPRLISKTN